MTSTEPSAQKTLFPETDPGRHEERPGAPAGDPSGAVSIGEPSLATAPIEWLQRADREGVDESAPGSEQLTVELLASVLDTLPAMITIADADGVTLFVNLATVQYTGLPLKELMRKGLLAARPPGDLKVDLTSAEVIYRLRRADDESRWHLVRRVPALRPDGTVLYTTSTAVDIDDLVHAREEMRVANEAKDELLGLVSHELRNPLATILAAARRLAIPGMVAPTEAETLAEVSSNASHLVVLIDNMLVLAHGDQPPELEPLMLQRIIPAAIARHQQTYPRRPVRFESQGKLPYVNGHAGWIEQVLENLLGNAEKYSPQGEQVTVIAETVGDGVAVRVLDRGIGIDRDHASQLFNAFHREEAARNIPGLGLGLAVCKRLVEMQAGSIWAAPHPDGGSEFGFLLRRVA